MLMTHVINLIIFVLIIVGVCQRKNRKIHPPLMFFCFVADLLLVLYIELTKGAVATVVGFKMSPFLAFHVVLSSLCLLVMNPIVLYSGYQKLKNKGGKYHLMLAGAFLILRFLNLVTSIMLPYFK